MDINDRVCLNCASGKLIKVPCIGAKSESDYMGFILCDMPISDHHRHLVSLHHTCAWHSDSVANDERFNKVKLIRGK